MDNPLILVIDDSQTIRKMVECHLSQAGYRVVTAADAERGLELPASLRPDLILLDHQLPGTTGDQVCRRLLEAEETSRIPVVISSAMRNRAFASYTEFTNVVDQIPKPFTPEMLKSGVANALETGAMVVQAQRTGCAIPEAVGEVHDATLEGSTRVFPTPVRARFPEQRPAVREAHDRDRQRSHPVRPRGGAGAGGLFADHRPRSAGGFYPRRPRRSRAAARPDARRTPGRLDVRAGQDAGAKPLRPTQAPFPAPLPVGHAHPLGRDRRAGDVRVRADHRPSPDVPGVPAPAQHGGLDRRWRAALAPALDLDEWGKLVFARQTVRGGSADRAGLTNPEIKIHTLLDGSHALADIALQAALSLEFVAVTVHGLELAGLVERKTPSSTQAILALDDDPETVRLLQRALGPEGTNHPIKVVRDRVAAQLLIRRQVFDLIILALDRPDQEAFFQGLKQQNTGAARFIGIASIEDEVELARLDAMGLDGVLHRPVSENDLLATVKHLLTQDRRQIACAG